MIAHEIGHNLGLLHDQYYASYGQFLVSDEGAKTEGGNPFSLMGKSVKTLEQTADFTLPAKVSLNQLYGLGNSLELGLLKSDNGDVLDVEYNESNLTQTDWREPTDSGPANRFRIYQSNRGMPPRALREANFTLIIPDQEMYILDEHFGNQPINPTGTGTAHSIGQTASDLNKTVEVLLVGSGKEANASIQFKKTNIVQLIISDGGRGYDKEPEVFILDENSTEKFMAISPKWIRETNNSLNQAMLLDHSGGGSKALRGVRLSTRPESLAPTGIQSKLHFGNYFWNTGPIFLLMDFSSMGQQTLTPKEIIILPTETTSLILLNLF